MQSKAPTIFKAEIAAKYGAPVYSRHPPITAIFPGKRNVYTNSNKDQSYIDTHTPSIIYVKTLNRQKQSIVSSPAWPLCLLGSRVGVIALKMFSESASNGDALMVFIACIVL